MPRQWTEAQKLARSEAYKKKALEAKAISPEAQADPNPMPDDVVESPTPLHSPRVKPQPHPSTFNVSSVVSILESIPLESLTFEDCAPLINACSSTITAITATRRQRIEQMQAAEHVAICYNPNCKKRIDISKSGGFQIRTERDELHMPVNRYYCSQNCLLYGAAPSHAKQTPKVKTGATA